METYDASRYRREWMEGQCEDNNPRKMTAEGSRHTSDTSQQPSAYGDQTSILKERSEMMKEMDEKIRKEMFERMKEMDNKIRKEMFERMKEMDDKIRKEMFEMTKEMDDKIRKEMFEITKETDNKITAFPGRAIQMQHQKKEEYEALKKRYQELLAKTVAKHQHSEDINDPLHLSAVLQKYKILQLQQWEKVRTSNPWRWTYEQGPHIIKKLFDACEKDIQQRTDDILQVLDIPLQSDTLTEETMREIRKLFRQSYNQYYPRVHNKIVKEADILTGTENQSEMQFLLQCCHIYCLLLLQDTPVKAEWKMNRRYLEHVDKKDPVHWNNPSLLWPIMKRGEDFIVNGVVWDQRK